MIIKLIACDVFARLLYRICADSPHIVDLELVPMLAHTKPGELRKELQKRLDSVSSDRAYDRVVLAYGLCGNATAGLSAGRIPLTIPRAHDCCTLLCGSKERFLETFGDALSTRWRSNGYAERCDIAGHKGGEQMQSYKTSREYMEYIEKYGEENADYLWEMLHPEIETDDAVYIRFEGFEHNDTFARFQREMDDAGKTLRLIEGSKSFLEELVNGPWAEERFLTVQPGEIVAGVYDMDTVIKAVPKDA